MILAIGFSSAVYAVDADIQVNQTVNNSAPSYNDNVKVTTTVLNKGPGNATGVKITQKIPNGLEYVSDDSNGAYNKTYRDMEYWKSQ